MRFMHFDHAITYAEGVLLSDGQDVDAGSWQGYKTQGKPDLVTKEILNLQLEVPVPDDLDKLRLEIHPNLPWADDHFEERVGRQPTNPGKEYMHWPWWQGQTQALEVDDEMFSHTYQERFWPRASLQGTRQGIRYEYGDLDSVVNHLLHNPMTRQATFPIFFPEDTGVSHGGRVPCTLHYHFMLRQNNLHMWYPIRSCDLVRHFRDDLYMACRLLLWVLNELQERELQSSADLMWTDVNPGTLYFTAYSFHVHYGDLHHVGS